MRQSRFSILRKEVLNIRKATEAGTHSFEVHAKLHGSEIHRINTETCKVYGAIRWRFIMVKRLSPNKTCNTSRQRSDFITLNLINHDSQN